MSQLPLTNGPYAKHSPGGQAPFTLRGRCTRPTVGGSRGWTLKYDEVLHVASGEAEVEESGGPTVVARAGEAILIGEGTTVTYRARPDTLIFFVLDPRDWDQRQ